jgi:hypothetical protein
MLLAIILILDVLLLSALGYAVRKDEIANQENLKAWGLSPVPVKVSHNAIWRAVVKKKVYDYLDRMVEPSGKNMAKHRYVHP